MALVRWNFVVDLVLYIVLFPFYIYALKKWYEWRDHCLFRYRHSKQAEYVIFFSIIESHVFLIDHALHDLGSLQYDDFANFIFNSIHFSLFWIIYFLVYYRTNLIYLTWKEYQMRINFNINSVTKTNNTESSKKHYSSKILLFMTYFGAFLNVLAILLAYSYPSMFFVFGVVWCINYITLITILLVIKIKKVKEMVGCLYEAYFVFAAFVLYWLVALFVGYGPFLYLQGVLVSHFFALFPLYYAVYLLYQFEGTLTKVNYEKEIESESAINMLQPVQPQQIQTETPKKSVKLKDYLSVQAQYEIFAQYLALCFCLENLLFVERVCIFRWIVIRMKLRNENDANHAIVNNLRTNIANINSEIKSAYSLKFEFLENIYKEYSDVIGDDVVGNFEHYRDLLWCIGHNIYKEFIDEFAVNQINIPYALRIDLTNALKSNENITKFESYDEFLTIFDDSILNIWRLLCGIYRFRFASYLKQQQTN